MKKFAAILLTLMLIIPFASCQKEKQTPYELYKAAYDKMSALDSYEMNIDMTMKMSMEGMDLEIPMDMNIKTAGLKTDSPVSRVVTTTEALGMSSTTDVYTAGEYSYYTAEEGNYKIKTELDEDAATGMNMLEADFEESAFEGAEITEDKDGNKTFALTLSSKQFADSFKDLIGSLTEENVNAEISDIKISVTVSSNGYFKALSMSFKMPMDMMETEVATEINMECEFVNPGTAVSVQAPEGYESYEDYSDDLGDLGDLFD